MAILTILNILALQHDKELGDIMWCISSSIGVLLVVKTSKHVAELGYRECT